MNVTVTVGGGSCKHITVTNTATGAIVGTIHRDSLGDVDVDGDHPTLNRIRDFVRRYKRTNPSATVAQIRTAVQAEDF